MIEQQEAIKVTTEKDYDFINKLAKEKQQKNKKENLVNELPEKKLKIPFDLKEDELIIRKQKIYGDNWEKICQFIDQRTFEEVYYEFHNRINPKLTSGRWTTRQSLMLIVLCEHFGVKRWALISQKLVVKSELQVRERYCNIIDPSIGKNLWTPEL